MRALASSDLTDTDQLAVVAVPRRGCLATCGRALRGLLPVGVRSPAAVAAASCRVTRRISGGAAGARTRDLRIKSPLLYQLSYRPTLGVPVSGCPVLNPTAAAPDAARTAGAILTGDRVLCCGATAPASVFVPPYARARRLLSLIAGRIGDPSFRKSRAAQSARIAHPTGPALGVGLVAGHRGGKIDPLCDPGADNPGLAQGHQRRDDLEGLPFDTRLWWRGWPSAQKPR